MTAGNAHNWSVWSSRVRTCVIDSSTAFVTVSVSTLTVGVVTVWDTIIGVLVTPETSTSGMGVVTAGVVIKVVATEAAGNVGVVIVTITVGVVRAVITEDVDA